jgi:hypothetical protein
MIFAISLLQLSWVSLLLGVGPAVASGLSPAQYLRGEIKCNPDIEKRAVHGVSFRKQNVQCTPPEASCPAGHCCFGNC